MAFIRWKKYYFSSTSCSHINLKITVKEMVMKEILNNLNQIIQKVLTNLFLDMWDLRSRRAVATTIRQPPIRIL